MAAKHEQHRPTSELVSSSQAPAPKWRIRLMEAADIDACLAIWARVELTEARQTVASALATDPAGFYVAELLAEPAGLQAAPDGCQRGARLVGMCAGTITRPDTAFMGFYAVEPELQGSGIGRELWARTMGRLKVAALNVGLYGVPQMSAKYQRSGFVLEDRMRMMIYESEAGPEGRRSLRLGGLLGPGDLAGCHLEVLHEAGAAGPELLQRIIDYDAAVQRFSRRQLLSQYLGEPGDSPLTVALVAGASRKSSDEQESQPAARVLGYGCLRLDNNDGAMLGPIYADSSDMCEVLLGALVGRFERSPEADRRSGFYLAMALSSNPAAAAILEKLGLRQTEQCSRMFTSFAPEADLERIYCVHSPNFTLF